MPNMGPVRGFCSDFRKIEIFLVSEGVRRIPRAQTNVKKYGESISDSFRAIAGGFAHPTPQKPIFDMIFIKTDRFFIKTGRFLASGTILQPGTLL